MSGTARPHGRVVSLAICLLMMNAAFLVMVMDAASALSEGDYTYTLSLSKGGTVATMTDYTGDGGAISIPSSFNFGEYPVRAIGEGAFDSDDGHRITSASIPSGVTTIRNNAFKFCQLMTSVTIPNTVTTIGDHAFDLCLALTSLAIPSSVTTIGDYAFFQCTSLSSITVAAGSSDFSSAGNVLYDHSKSTLIKYAGRQAGSSFSIPDTVSIIANGAFDHSHYLESVSLPNSVRTIGDRAFSDCTQLATAALPTGVTTIGDYAFLRTVLTSVNFPSSVTSIGDGAYLRTDLTSAIIPSSVTSIGVSAFSHCDELTTLAVSPSNPSYSSVSNVLYNKAVTALLAYPGGKAGSFTIPSTVTSIGQDAFGGCSGITSVIVPSGVTTIGSDAFSDCDHLTSISFYGLVAPTTVGVDWLDGTPGTIRGHARTGSNFPAPGGVWHGLTMGTALPASPSGPPTGLNAVPGDTRVTLTWNAPADNGGASINYYVVYMNGFDVDHVTGTTATVDGLWNGDTYSFAVAAHNSAGTGDRSATVSSTPTPVTVPGAPVTLTATPGDGQVHLSWGPPTSDGGAAIDHYVIYQNGADVVHESGTSRTITSLTNGASYDFAVAAHNSAGVGTMSPVVSATPKAPLALVMPPSAPTALTATPGDGQASLSWNAPADNGGAAIDHYVVYQDGSSVATVTGTSATVSGLMNGIPYSFTVAAHNSAAIGEVSEAVVVTPSATATVPGAPTELNATGGDGQVMLSWNPPANNGGRAVTGYLIHWGTDPSSSDGPISTTGTSYLHEGLENGQVLYYWVSAVNEVGEGDTSDVASATPSASLSLPSAPTGLTASIISGYVSLNWTAPADGALDIVGFRVYRGASVPTMQMIASVIGTTFMDNTVTGNQTYYYQVSAVNDAGEGERSGEVNVTLSSSSPSGTSSSFLDTLEGQLAVAGLAIAGVAGAGYLLWRRRRQ